MKVYILLENGFEEIEALAVTDILRRAEIPTELVSAKNSEYVTGAHNIVVKTDICIKDVSDFDMLILPGGYPGYENLENNKFVESLVKTAADNNKYIAAICAAPSILGKWGYLKGKKSCCYPSFEEYLEESDVNFDKVTHDGNFITSRGAGTAHNFAFKIVEVLKNKEIAGKIAKSMIYDL